ncbi:nmrA-like family protein [Sodiomyces alkalinus F11]|uniref:NmrA-like family protein n=1 Tax=Sodiomyces alkalinus (strain CBS 110278 / VKM F-3762 / F11) TaxID=1314773 RepID=A0A3N2PPW4_SODAK|nr:nmrA-like family protein [Sodiomyces alkalinus F11]ROT36480.1 nmrA-like family protein [Sodiomyces alkalinus F11]
MATIAVAGGTGSVGKTIVRQLLADGTHQVIVLGRKPPVVPLLPGAEFLVVGYSDVQGLVNILEGRNVETVISALDVFAPEGSQAQLNLIAASDQSTKTRRFIPSEYAAAPDDGTNEWDVSAFARPAAAALKKTGLQYTRVVVGFLMDYWGMPHIPSDMAPGVWAVDVANKRAAMPGTGNEPLTLTYSVDMAGFIARLLEVDEWPELSIISGSDTTLNELIAIAEKVRGTKFDVVYDSQEKLERNEPTMLVHEAHGGISVEQMRQMNVLFGLATISGRMIVPKENRLNERLPDIRPMTIEELITKAWAGK